MNDSAVGDAASRNDTLGFGPYVKGLASFLTSRKTFTPLTVSIEGAWGSGKSSLMLQLEDVIQATPGPKNFIVTFNAWRYDKDEALWASFALNFSRQLRMNLPWFRRLPATLNLSYKRLDWDNGLPRIVWVAVKVVALLGAFLYALGHLPGVSTASSLPGSSMAQELIGKLGLSVDAASVSRITVFLAAIGASAAQAWRLVGSPFERDISKYFDSPNYRGKRAFIERFHADFSKIVRAYLRKDERVFVFIDDLDRCDVPRAAELLQAINLLMSSDDLPIVYVVGMDRYMVSAGVAAKLEKQAPYLYPQSTGSELATSLMGFAGEYVEKFFQIPFRVPVAEDNIEAYVTSMSSGTINGPAKRSGVFWDTWFQKQISTKLPNSGADDPLAKPPKTPATLWIDSGADAPIVAELAKSAAPVFKFNPRRIKQFVNLLRMQAHLAQALGLFVRDAQSEALTFPQLAKFTAATLRYPGLAARLRTQRNLLGKLYEQSISEAYGEDGKQSITRKAYASDDRFMQTIFNDDALLTFLASGKGDPNYSLQHIDVRKLLNTMPARSDFGRPQQTTGTETPAPDAGRVPDPEDVAPTPPSTAHDDLSMSANLGLNADLKAERVPISVTGSASGGQAPQTGSAFGTVRNPNSDDDRESHDHEERSGDDPGANNFESSERPDQSDQISPLP